MSSGHAPITPVRVYVTVWVGLLVLTIATYFAAKAEFGVFNTPIALTIAVTKATLVIWFFMGLRYNTPLTKVAAVSGFVWLLILFIIGMSDYISRPWIHVPGR